jgi:hypothetical protein
VPIQRQPHFSVEGQNAAEIRPCDDWYILVDLQLEEMAVVRNNKISPTVASALQNPVVVWVGPYNPQFSLRGDDLRRLCDYSNPSLNPLLLPMETGAQHLGQLPNHGRGNQ